MAATEWRDWLLWPVRTDFGTYARPPEVEKRFDLKRLYIPWFLRLSRDREERRAQLGQVILWSSYPVFRLIGAPPAAWTGKGPLFNARASEGIERSRPPPANLPMSAALRESLQGELEAWWLNGGTRGEPPPSLRLARALDDGELRGKWDQDERESQRFEAVYRIGHDWIARFWPARNGKPDYSSTYVDYSCAELEEMLERLRVQGVKPSQTYQALAGLNEALATDRQAAAVPRVHLGPERKRRMEELLNRPIAGVEP